MPNEEPVVTVHARGFQPANDKPRVGLLVAVLFVLFSVAGVCHVFL